MADGSVLYRWTTAAGVRCVAFAEGDRKALMVTDNTMGQVCTIHIVPICEDMTDQTDERLNSITVKDPKVSSALWGSLNKTIVTGHIDGKIALWDPETGDCLNSIKHHSGLVQDIQFGPEMQYFITASKDHTSLLINAETLEVLKRYETERPVNAAAISPIKPHIILGGGQDAMSVTTTSSKQGKFEVRFFHLPFELEMGRVKGHFGPINTLAFHPDGKGFASGGEDGYIRIHFFDDDYYNFRYPEEKEL